MLTDDQVKDLYSRISSRIDSGSGSYGPYTEKDLKREYPTQEEIDAEPGVLKRGFMGGGVYGGASLLTGAAGLAADAVGADDTAKSLYETSMDIARAGQEKYTQKVDFDKVLDDPNLSNIVEWLGYNAAATIPMMATSMGIGSLTSFGAKAFGKQLLVDIGENAVKNATTEEIVRLGSDKIAKAAINNAVARIGNVGSAAAISAPEAGGMWINDVQKHGVEGSSPFIDALMGGVSGSLEMLPFGVESSFIKAAFGEAGESAFKESVRKGEKEISETMLGKALQRLNSGVKEGGKEFLGEGLQESGQELVSMTNEAMLAQPGENPDLYNAKGAKRLLESGLVGGAVGFGPGTVLGSIHHNAEGAKIQPQSEVSVGENITDILSDSDPAQEAPTPKPEARTRTADQLIDILDPQDSSLDKNVKTWVSRFSPRDFNAEPSFPSDTNIDGNAAQSFRAFDQGQPTETRDSVLSQRQTEQQKLAGVLSGLAQAKQNAEIQAQEQAIVQSPMGAELLRQRLINEQGQQPQQTQPQDAQASQEYWPGSEPMQLPRSNGEPEMDMAAHEIIKTSAAFAPTAEADYAIVNHDKKDGVNTGLFSEKITEDPKSIVKESKKDSRDTEPKTESIAKAPEKIVKEPESIGKVSEKIGELSVGSKIEWNDKSGNTLAGTIIGLKGNRYEIERENPKPGQGRKTFLHTGYDVREVGKEDIKHPEEAAFSILQAKDSKNETAFVEPESNYNSVADVEHGESQSRTEETGFPKVDSSKGIEGDRLIGKNKYGQEVYEDKNGARSYLEGNIKVSEPVAIVPGFGKEISIGNQERFDKLRHRHLTNEEYEALKSQKLKPTENTDELEKPKETVSLSDHFAKKLEEGHNYKTIIEARKEAGEIVGKQITAGSEDVKTVDEAVETGVTKAARRIIEKERASGKNEKEIFDAVHDLYKRQPNLISRTSTSISQQAYSTPAPIAFLASHLAGINKNTSVYEPTAGNGMLLIDASTQKAHANELNPGRAANLESQGFTVSKEDATVFKPSERTDVVIANPPFGRLRDNGGIPRTFDTGSYKTHEIDHAIALKALENMKDNGRAVLILGGKKGSDETRAKKYHAAEQRQFYKALFDNYNVTDHFTIDGKLYEKQGAGYPIDVIIIDGRGKTTDRKFPAAQLPRIYKSFDELRGLINEKQSDSISEGRAEDGKPVSGISDVLAAGERDNKSDGSVPKGNDENRNNGSVDKPVGKKAGMDTEKPGIRSEGVSGIHDVGTEQDGVRGVRAELDGDTKGKPGGNIKADKSVLDEKQDDGNSKSEDSGLSAENDKGTGRSGRNSADVDSGLDKRNNRKLPVERKETNHQVSYSPKSGSQGMGTLIPKNMASSVDAALEAIEEKHGDIDSYVAKKLGYKPKDIGKYFAAEQVDAIALAVSNLEKGSGFIIGDQTGIGKGRVNAAIIKYAKESGKTPVFVTMKPELYADMIRDLSDIGVNGFNPLPTNSDLSGQKEIPLPDGRVLKTGAANRHNGVLSEIIQSGDLGNYDAVFTTYDQLNPVNGKDTIRRDLLMKIAPDAIFILDESHNAGGTENSKTAKGAALNRASFTRKMLASSGNGVFYSSATYAKRPDVMGLYFKTDMRLAVPDGNSLSDVISSGGIPMQQIVASMLSESGQYIRRERSFEGATVESIVSEIDKSVPEGISGLMAKINEFNKIKQQVVADIKDELMGAGLDMSEGHTESTIESANFTSIMHNLISQSLLTIKADAAVKEALDALSRNEKPIITLSNTMGSFIGEYASDNSLSNGDPIRLSMKDLFKRYLEKTRSVTEKGPDGKSTVSRILTEEELGPEAMEAYDTALDAIDNADIGEIPVSPIDHIKNELAKKGFRVGEITGRTATIDYSGPVPRYATKKTSSAEKIKTVSDFNSGALDALVINVSGSTGISLHSSSKFKDQRKRTMIIAQPELNIDVFMQMLGRVFRTGQVVPPAYKLLSLNTPAEKRPAAILSKKMASLNANTTASRTSDTTFNDAPDFLNKYGDEIVSQIMMDNHELHERLGSPLTLGESAEDDAARRVTGRIPLLPVAEQEKLYSMIESEYADRIKELEAMGIDDLEAKTLKLDARLVSKNEFTAPIKNKIKMGNTIIESESVTQSPFTAPSYLCQYDVKKLGKPYTSEKVKSILAERLGLEPDASMQDIIKAGEKESQEIIESARKEGSEYFGKKISEITDTAKKERLKERSNDSFKLFMNYVNFLEPGSPVSLRTEDFIIDGIVLGIDRKGHADNPLALGQWKATIALADATRQLTIPLSRIDISGVGASTRKISIDSSPLTVDKILSQMDKGQSESREQVYIITGNILAAYNSAKNGKIINFEDSDGNIIPGLMLSKNANIDSLVSNVDINVPSASDAILFLDSVENGVVKTADKALVLSLKKDKVLISAQGSKAKGGKYFLNTAITDITGDFVKSGNYMSVNTSRDKAEQVVSVLMNTGTGFVIDNFRDRAKQLFGVVGSDPESSEASGIKYSLSDSKTKGLSKTKISEALKPASSRMAFEVVQNESELPSHIKDDIGSKGFSGRAEALFDPESGKVYFVADNIGSEKAAQTGFLENLFRHEGRHAAISQMFESRGARNMFMDRASRLFKSDVAAYLEKNGLENTKENTRTAAEEALVNQAVKGGVHALLDEFMGKIVRWARKIFPNLSMTRAEARAFIRRADSMIESGFSGKSDGKGVLESPKFKLSDKVINKQIYSEAFKKWFGDWEKSPGTASKAIDDSGKPKIFYHGTSSSGFDFFDTYGGRYGLYGLGSYFTDNATIADEYTEKGRGKSKGVYPVYLDVKNPMDMDAIADKKWRDLIDNEDFWNGEKTNNDAFREFEEQLIDEQIPDYEGAEIVLDAIRDMGYDSVSHIGGGRHRKSDGIKHNVFIVFDPEQIKSAIGNKGTFDSANPDIRYSLKDRTTPLSELGIKTEYSDIKSKDKDGNETVTRQLVITGNFKDEYKKLMPIIGGEYKYQKTPGSRGVTTRNTYVFKNPSETIESDIARIIKGFHMLDDFGLSARFREKDDGSKLLFVDGNALHNISGTMAKLGGKFIKPQDGRKPYFLFTDPEASTPLKIAEAAKAFDDSLSKMLKVSRDKSSEVIDAIVKPKDESARAMGKRIIEDIKSIFSKSDIVLPSNNTDIPKWFHQIQTESDMAKNHPEFQKLYDIETQFEAKATQKTAEDRESTKPYYDLGKEERKPIDRVLLYEDENRTEATAKELETRFGLNEKQIAGYYAIRNLYKKKLREVVHDMLKNGFSDFYFDDKFVQEIIESDSREAMISMLKDHGVKESDAKKLSWLFDWVNERKGYIPHKWDSEWLVRINMPDGDTWLLDVPTVTGNILPTKALREGAANKAAVRVIKERIGWSDSQIKEWIDAGNILLVKNKELPVDMFHGASMHTMNAIIESATERAWEEYKDAFTPEQLMKQQDLKEAIRKEMEELFLAKGAGQHFITRKGVKGFRTDIANITGEYVSGMNHWMVKRDKSAAFTHAMKDIDPKKKPELFKHARAFVDDMLGESQEASAFKKFAGIWFLGADVSAAALNSLQNFTHAAPKMMKIKGKGSVYAELGKAMKDCFNEWRDSKKSDRFIFSGESKHLKADEIEAIRTLYMQGFFDPAVVGEQTGFHPSSIWNNYADKTTKLLMGMFTGVESLNRSSTFLAAYRRAKEAKIENPIEIAKQITMDAHFPGGKKNRPMLIRRMGLVGNVAYTFMMFPVNNLFFLKDIFKDALTAIHGRNPEQIKTELKVIGSHLGALLTLGGLSALPFASILAPIAKGIFSDDDDDWEVALRKHMSPEVGRLLVRGLPALMGNDMSGRVSSDVIGMPSGFGVIQTMAKRANKAADYAVQGETLDALMMLTPDFIRNPYTAVMGMEEGGERRGRPPVKYTGWQAVNKALGFSPTAETEAYAAKQNLDNVKAKRSDNLADFAERLLQLQKKNDSISISKLRKELSEYNELQKKDNDPLIKWSDVIKSANQKRKMRNKGYLDRIPGKMKAQKNETFEAMGV